MLNWLFGAGFIFLLWDFMVFICCILLVCVLGFLFELLL